MLPALLQYPALALRQSASRRTLVVIVAAIVAIWPTWPALFETWNNVADYSHGPIVAALVVLWLVRSAGEITAAPRGAAWTASLLLLLVLCAWLVAYRANIEIGKQLLAPPIIALSVASVCGWRALTIVTAPISYLYFAIPVWEALVPLLQRMTVAAAEAAMALLGIATQINGVIVTIPEGSFIVQEGCSGKKYFIVSLALAALYAAMARLGRPQALIYLALTAVLALVSNWLRVVIVIYAGHVSNMQHYLVRREHLTLGWGIFIILLICVFVLGSRFRGAHTRPPARASEVTAPAGRSPRLLATVALLCIPLVGMAYFARQNVDASSLQLRPFVPLGWHGPLTASTQWRPRFDGAASEFRGAFESPDADHVEVYAAKYARQRPGAELIQYSNTTLGVGWRTVHTSASVRTLRNGERVPVVTLEAQSPSGAAWLVDYFYDVDGLITAHDWMAQLAYGLKWRGATASGVTSIATACAVECGQANREIAAFWQSLDSLP